MKKRARKSAAAKKEAATAPMLLKLTFGSITGWWRCLRCGWELPGELNPENHNCRADRRT